MAAHKPFLSLMWVTVLLASTLFAQKNDRVVSLMEELTNAHGPSGFEGPVREIFTRELRSLGAEVSTDGLGSVIGTVRGLSAGPRVMIDAHLDEVGLMVRYIMPSGFIKVQELGGWFDQALIDQRWVIVTSKGPVHAVSGILDAHLGDLEELFPETKRGKGPFEKSKVFLDVGARSREEAEAMGIRPGDPISPWSPFTILGNNRYAAKAWDDRIGLVIILEVLRRLRDQGIKTANSLYLVGTVQEEIGLRGAVTAAHVIKPDLGIALEVGIAADYPGAAPEQAEERLGAGPAIFLYDNSMLPNLKLRNFFLNIAAEKKIPLQTDLVQRYGQDGASIQLHATGTPAINFVVPTRYTHSHTGIIDRADFDRAVDLLVEVLTRLDAKTVKEIASF